MTSKHTGWTFPISVYVHRAVSSLPDGPLYGVVRAFVEERVGGPSNVGPPCVCAGKASGDRKWTRFAAWYLCRYQQVKNNGFLTIFVFIDISEGFYARIGRLIGSIEYGWVELGFLMSKIWCHKATRGATRSRT